MRSYKIVFCFLLYFCVLEGSSQTDSLKKNDRYFRYNYDNDFFSATDRYYTQGVYLELILPAIKKTILARTLAPLKKSNLNYYGISIERQGFTPRSIRHEGIFYGERPFACVFYVSHSLISIRTEKRMSLSTKLDLGIIGPNARGAEEQKGIHYALNNIQPLGWENQINNDYVINYDVQLEKGLLMKKHIEFMINAEAKAGTLYDDIGLGGLLRVGRMHSYFTDLGMTRQKGVQKFQCYAFVKGKVKAVGYNATMQGGVFNKNSIYTIPSDDIERVVGVAYYGIVITYRKVSLGYSKSKISSEFKNGLCHGWGRVTINVCF